MDNPLYASLKKMVMHCQDMQELLETDIDSFSKNDLASVGESNKRKAHIIGQLNASLSELNMIRAKYNASGFMDAIEKTVARSETKTKQEMQKTVNTLKKELTRCYKYLLMNNNIVFANMQQLKDIWDQLLDCSNDMSCVYDHMGNTKR